MPVKILFVGDQHVQPENIPEINMLIEKLVLLAHEFKPDRIVLGGDLCHTHEWVHSSAMNKAYELVRKMREITRTYVLVGNHDFCLGRDVPVLVWNGTTKMSQKIRENDILIGDDNLPRRVTSSWKGKQQMYKITQSNGMTYEVTGNHILCVKYRSHREIIWNETEKFCKISWFDKTQFKPNEKIFRVRDGDKQYSKQVVMNIASSFLDKVADQNDTIEIPVEKLYNNQDQMKLCGYSISVSNPEDYRLSDLEITKLDGIRKYYGFEVDGNHRFLLGDRTVTHNCSNQEFLSENHWLNGLKEWENVTVVDKVLVEVIKQEKFVFVPYVPNGRFIEALNTVGDTWRDASCIFAHQEFAGCKMGGIISVEGDRWPIKNTQVVSGHIHKSHKPQKNIYYSGSAIQVAFGESEHNVIPCLTFSSKKMTMDEVDLKLPRKKIVHLDIDDIDEYEHPVESTNEIKVSITGNYEQFKALKKTTKYKQLVNKGVKVVFKAAKNRGVTIPDDNMEINSANFTEICNEMVLKKCDPYLCQAYEYVVNGKRIKEDDVMFV